MNKRVLICAGLAVMLLMATRVQAQEDPNDPDVIHEAFPATMPLDPIPAAIEPLTPVSLDRAEAFQEGVNVHELSVVSEVEIERVEQSWVERHEDPAYAPPRIGLVRMIEPGPLSVRNGSALVTELGSGRKLWTLVVQSPLAFGIRLHFTNFDVGAGSVLVYSFDNQGELVVLGPFTGTGPERDGDFWTGSLPGEQAFIEITGNQEPRFEIPDIVHFDRNPDCPDQTDCEAAMDDGPPLLGCHLDANCYLDSISVGAKNATGRMHFCHPGGGCGTCTGTLLIDKDDETWVPYFITARHCLSTQTEVDTLEVIWGYETDSCDGTVPNLATLPRSVGGTKVTSYGENDMMFIRLHSVPAGSSFAGWTTSTSSGRYGIHHPKGSWKRVVFLDEVGFCPLSCWCGDATDYDYYDMTSGLTQPGSSGSGVFNGSGQLAGQLKGKCSASHDAKELTCSNIDSYVNMYGEFETTYGRISRYLWIGGTMHVDWSVPLPQFGNGTAAFPYETVGQANNAAWDGLRIKIQAGSYPETLTMSKELTLLAVGGTVTIGQ